MAFLSFLKLLSSDDCLIILILICRTNEEFTWMPNNAFDLLLISILLLKVKTNMTLAPAHLYGKPNPLFRMQSADV